MTNYSKNQVQNLLPLAPAAFHILLALSAGERHGYGIIQDVDAQTDGAVRLSPGTLYRTIQRLLEEGLITEPYAPLAQRMFASMTQLTAVTMESDVAEAVWLAANDTSGRLHYPAGADAVALAAGG